jgi:shikimate dehydrogenase
MTTRRVGLIGDPVAHSISPAIQNAAFAAQGIDAAYELWQTDLGDLPGRVASLRDPQVLGANVTVPHKRAVIEHLDSVSEAAVRAGAVNTIVHRDGRLSGDNTDIAGFATGVREVCPDAGARAALVLGAGGAARAVVLALAGLGVDRVTVANRNQDRSAALAADLAPIDIDRIGLDRSNLERSLPGASILINSTSLGWHPGESPLEPDLLDLLPETALVVDLTYRDTDLLAAARSRGLGTLDGLPMLVYQGAAAFSLWTAVEAPVAEMLSAARIARDARR